MQAVDEERWKEEDWSNDAFGMSKLGQALLSRLFHNRVAGYRKQALAEVRAVLKQEQKARHAQQDAELKVASMLP